MTRAALYARISQDDLGLEKGVTRQLEDTRALAAQHGWEVVAEYQDNDVSAFNGATRAGYLSLMSAVESGQVDRIVVYQTSRLWRSRTERSAAIGMLGRRQVAVAAVRGPDLDLSSAQGRMMAGVLGEFDTMESEVKGERVARAALQRAQEGRSNGRIAYGWKRERVLDDSGRIVGFNDVEHPEQAPVVREIVKRLLGGDSLRGIADDLTARGVPAPSRREGGLWYRSMLRLIALRPANIALRVHKGEIIGPAAWPAIVERDQYDRVVALLGAPERHHVRDGSRRHLLTFGIGECGVCGGALRVTFRRSRTPGRAPMVLYVCNGRGGCVGRSMESVDELTGAVVIARLARPDAAAVFAGDDEAAIAASEHAEAIRARLAAAADGYADGRVTIDQLTRINARLRPDLEEAEEQVRRARPPSIPDAAEGLLGEQAASVWAELSVTAKRAVMTALGLHVVIKRRSQHGPGFQPEDVEFRWA